MHFMTCEGSWRPFYKDDPSGRSAVSFVQIEANFPGAQGLSLEALDASGMCKVGVESSD